MHETLGVFYNTVVITDDPKSSTATLDALRRENAQLCASLHQSSQEVKLLRASRDEFAEQLIHKNHEIAGLQHQLQALLRRSYGRSAEKIDPKQMLLFEELLQQLAPETTSETPDKTSGETSTTPSADAPKSARKGHGRRRFPSHLEREKVVHDVPDDEKPCPCRQKLRHVIGRETHEQIEYIPAKVKVIEHVRLKYACAYCEVTAAPDGPRIVTAEKPLSPIEKGMAAPGLLSYVIVSKYGDHLPLHRLEGILKRHGITIARSTMCDWAAQCATGRHSVRRR